MNFPPWLSGWKCGLTPNRRPSASKLWTATYGLMGLKYSKEVASHLLEGVHDIQESTTYQAILSEGRSEGLVEGRKEGLLEGRITGERQVLIRQGTKKFGPPDTAILAAIEAIRDVDRLDALCERILDSDVRDWNSLLGAP